MAFPVEITPIAEAQIEQAYRWYQEAKLTYDYCDQPTNTTEATQL